MHEEVYTTQEQIKQRWAERTAQVEEVVGRLQRLGHYELARHCSEIHAQPIFYVDRYYQINGQTGAFDVVTCHECGEWDLTQEGAIRRQCTLCRRESMGEYEDRISYAEDEELEEVEP